MGRCRRGSGRRKTVAMTQVFPIFPVRSSAQAPPGIAGWRGRGYGTAAFADTGFALSERGLSDIFQEIDEDLRRDRYAKLWAQYRWHLIVLLVAVIVGVSGYTGWRQYQLSQRQAEGVRFAAALDLEHEGNDKAATDAFAGLAASAGGRLEGARRRRSRRARALRPDIVRFLARCPISRRGDAALCPLCA